MRHDNVHLELFISDDSFASQDVAEFVAGVEMDGTLPVH